MWGEQVFSDLHVPLLCVLCWLFLYKGWSLGQLLWAPVLFQHTLPPDPLFIRRFLSRNFCFHFQVKWNYTVTFERVLSFLMNFRVIQWVSPSRFTSESTCPSSSSDIMMMVETTSLGTTHKHKTACDKQLGEHIWLVGRSYIIISGAKELTRV